MDKVKFPALEAVKWVILALALVFLWNQAAQGRESAADFQTVAEQVVAAMDLSNTLEGDNQMVKRLYGLDPADYEGVLLYYPATNMGSEELLLVKLRDTSQQEAVKAAIEARVAGQMASFDGYGIDQYDMLERSITEVRGNYILLVSAADPTPIRQAFLDAL